jgi:hypothetical protein
MAELGRIEKPEVEGFKGKRKLYCVTSLYATEFSEGDLLSLINRFWDEVSRQIERLEFAGEVKKIFVENIYAHGEEGLEILKRLNEKAFAIVKNRIDKGAIFLPLEREEIFGPYMDWANCLSVIRTKEVFEKIYGFYKDLHERRIKYIQNLIETNLLDGEAGLLIMDDEDRMKIQLPPDIEVFLVTPPSYDDILKWLRKRMENIEKRQGDVQP